MKENPKDPKGHVIDKDEKPRWFDSLNPVDIMDMLPIITSRSSKGQSMRVQLPVHNSTEVVATMVREQCPHLGFKINLDVYRSMLYAGRQLFELVYLRDEHLSKRSKKYKMNKILEAVDLEIFSMKWLEEKLESLMEGYLSQGQGTFSRDKIIGTIDELRPFLSEELQARCDNFVDEELDSDIAKIKIKERLRKREYRKRKETIKLVSG